MPSGEEVCHTFFQLDDGSHLAFFDAPKRYFDFKTQSDFDLHIAFETTPEILQTFLKKAKSANMEWRGPSDHGFIHSIYLRDPNGYVIELCHMDKNAKNHFETSRKKCKGGFRWFYVFIVRSGKCKTYLYEDTW